MMSSNIRPPQHTKRECSLEAKQTSAPTLSKEVKKHSGHAFCLEVEAIDCECMSTRRLLVVSINCSDADCLEPLNDVGVVSRRMWRIHIATEDIKIFGMNHRSTDATTATCGGHRERGSKTNRCHAKHIFQECVWLQCECARQSIEGLSQN